MSGNKAKDILLGISLILDFMAKKIKNNGKKLGDLVDTLVDLLIEFDLCEAELKIPLKIKRESLKDFEHIKNYPIGKVQANFIEFVNSNHKVLGVNMENFNAELDPENFFKIRLQMVFSDFRIFFEDIEAKNNNFGINASDKPDGVYTFFHAEQDLLNFVLKPFFNYFKKGIIFSDKAKKELYDTLEYVDRFCNILINGGYELSMDVKNVSVKKSYEPNPNEINLN